MLSLIVGPTRAFVSVTHDEVDRGHGPYGFSLELPWPRLEGEGVEGSGM